MKTAQENIDLPQSGTVAVFDNMQTMFILLPCSYAWHLHKHYAEFPHPANHATETLTVWTNY